MRINTIRTMKSHWLSCRSIRPPVIERRRFGSGGGSLNGCQCSRRGPKMQSSVGGRSCDQSATRYNWCTAREGAGLKKGVCQSLFQKRKGM
ncbi:hypothetical protein FKM82_030225 [Ascaphus truei]